MNSRKLFSEILVVARQTMQEALDAFHPVFRTTRGLVRENHRIEHLPNALEMPCTDVGQRERIETALFGLICQLFR